MAGKEFERNSTLSNKVTKSDENKKLSALIMRINNDADDIADQLIDVLKTLNEEYDSLGKQGKEVIHPNAQLCTTPDKKPLKPVEEILENTCAILKEIESKHEDICDSRQEIEIRKEIASLEKNRDCVQSKMDELKRKYKLQESRLMELKERIKSTDSVEKEIAIIEKQLYDITVFFQREGISEDLYPTNMSEKISILNDLRSTADKLQKEMISYNGLPPDFREARVALIKKLQEEAELDDRIRKTFES